MKSRRVSRTSYPYFILQAEDGIRDGHVTGVQTCALPISNSHRHVVTEKIKQPVAADQRQRQGAQDDQYRDWIAEVHEQQQDDDANRCGNDQLESVGRALHELVLARPAQGVARRQLDLFGHGLFGALDVAAEIRIIHVNVDPAVESRILRADHPGPGLDPKIGHGRQGDLLAARRDDGQVAQLLHRLAFVARIANVDRIAFQPLDALADGHAAHGRAHDLVHVADVEPEAGRLLALDVDGDVAPASDAVGVDGRGAWNIFDNAFDFRANPVDDLQIGPGNLDADWGLDAGGQHVDAVLDRHDPG